MRININIKWLKFIILFISLIISIVVFSYDPIAQNAYYFKFADERSLLGIPNFFNVVSNICFLVIGIYGLYLLNYTRKLAIVDAIKTVYQCFFIGIALVAFGSAYFHYQPSNATLIWDRLPMSLSFMALMTIAIAEFLSLKWAKIGFMPMLIMGLISVIYWYYSEVQQQGDLRFYILVQLLPILLIFILLLAGKNVFDTSWGYWGLFISYMLGGFKSEVQLL